MPYGTTFAVRLATGGVRAWWPDTNPTFITVLAVILIAVVVGLVVWVWVAVGGLRPKIGDPYRTLATEKDLHPHTPAGARRQAGRLRPSLAHVDRNGYSQLTLAWCLGRFFRKDRC